MRSLTNRLAWRDITTHKVRSVLIVLLVLLPVATIGLLSGFTLRSYTVEQQLASQFGDGVAKVVPLESADGTCLQRNLGQAHCETADESAAGFTPTPLDKISIPGSSLSPLGTATLPLAWRSTTLDAKVIVHDAAAHPARFVISSGANPGDGEVLLMAANAKQLGLKVGDSVTLADRTLRVSGTVRTSAFYDAWFMVAPGHPIATDVTWLEASINGPVPTKAQIDDLNRQGVAVLSREVVGSSWGDGTEAATATAIVIAIGVLILMITATIAAAAFSIGVRQQRRVLSLLGATGAPSKVLRAMVTRQGLLLGAVASGLGVVIGAAAGLLIQWWDDRNSATYPQELSVAWVPLGVLAVIGTLSSVIAAWVPSRQVVKLDVVAGVKSAEAAAPPPKRPWLSLGIALIGIGAGVAGAAIARVNQGAYNKVEEGVLPAVVSVVAMFVAALLALGWLLHQLGRVIGRGPLPVRLAARDWSRNRGRAAASVAATVAMMALATTALTANASVGKTALADYRASMPEGFVVVTQWAPPPGSDKSSDPGRARARLEQAVSDVLGPPKARMEMKSAVAAPLEDGHRPDAFYVDIRCARDGCPTRASNETVIGDAKTVAFLTRSPATNEVTQVLEQGGAVVFSDGLVVNGKITLQRMLGEVIEVPAIQAGNTNAPTIISEALVKKHVPDATIETRTVWLDVGRVPTDAEGVALHQAVFEYGSNASVGLTWEPGARDQYGVVTTWFFRVFAALLICVATITTALALRDARASMTTLATVGASRGTLRGMTAVMAASTTLLGLVLGVVVALVPLVLSITSAGTVVRLSIPWRYLAALLVGVPVALAVVGALIPPAKASAIRSD